MLRYLNRKRTTWIIGLLLLLLVLAPMVASAERSTKSTSDPLLRKEEITIDEKGADYVASVEWRFELDDTSVLTDTKNRTISVGEIPVPCVAEIEYRLQIDKNPLLLGLKIKRSLPAARTD
jgi:hypothetical protein